MISLRIPVERGKQYKCRWDLEVTSRVARIVVECRVVDSQCGWIPQGYCTSRETKIAGEVTVQDSQWTAFIGIDTPSCSTKLKTGLRVFYQSRFYDLGGHVLQNSLLSNKIAQRSSLSMSDGMPNAMVKTWLSWTSENFKNKCWKGYLYLHGEAAYQSQPSNQVTQTKACSNQKMQKIWRNYLVNCCCW